MPARKGTKEGVIEGTLCVPVRVHASSVGVRLCVHVSVVCYVSESFLSCLCVSVHSDVWYVDDIVAVNDWRQSFFRVHGH